ncbi:MAG TPA: tripartite tricarboxylate transporter TctB family protein [Burkholderiales bacterium]|nr:tripartite tricarboxylate transporter TctB family protein [Burkholderiales bacterium]
MNFRKPAGADRASALVCFGFAIGVGIEACRLGLGTLGSPGAGLTPLLYAGILAVLSLLLFIRSRGPSDEPEIVMRWRAVVPILGILLVYALTIEWLGYITCTFVAMFLLLQLAHVRRVNAVLFAAIATALIHVVFVRWLLVPLPIGSIFP